MSIMQDLQKLYIDVLDEDYKTSIDSDGDVVLKHPDMGTLYVSLHEKDPEYFCLVYPNFLSSQQAQEDFHVDEHGFFQAVNKTNRTCKGASLMLHWSEQERAWIASARIEAFLAGPDQLPDAALIKATFKRYMSALRFSAEALANHLRSGGKDGGNSSSGDAGGSVLTH